jgi:alanine racemase
MMEVARTCLASGAAYLAVATLEEAITLREKGIQAPVLVLGYTPEEHAADAVFYDVDLAVFSLQAALAISEAACQQNKVANIHIKLDTGMGRIGFYPDEQSLEAVLQISRLSGIRVQGIFSHFATADQKDKTFARQQYQVFASFIAALEATGLNIPLKHLANSAAIMELSQVHYNMVRSGIITYGLYPSDEVDRTILSLEPAMRLITKIAYLKTIPAGRSVSYGRNFMSQQETRVATVPIGYADGYRRSFSNRAWATLRGHKVPLIGNVCMDQCMFDVTGVENVQEGDELILFGRPEDGVTADALAALIGTINYEIVCSPSHRVPRIYIG